MTRLKMPKVSRQPRMAEERSEDRCYSLSTSACLCRERWTYFVVQDPLDHDETPCHKQGLDGVGEGVCLVRPGHVRGGDQRDGQSSMPGRLNEFMYCPIFQYEAQDEHQGP